MLDQSYYQKADEIIAFYGKKPSSLIPVMQDIQGVYRYLPGELLTYVAKEIGVKEAKAYSVGDISMKTFPLSRKASTSSRYVTVLPVMYVSPCL